MWPAAWWRKARRPISRGDFLRAAREGDLALTKKAVKRGADVNVKNCALIEAASNCEWKIVRYLMKEGGADVNAADEDGWTALMYAAVDGRLELVRYLAKEGGADANAMTITGETALMYAASNGHLEVVRYLEKEGGADVNATDEDRSTALMRAAVNGYFELVQYLVEAGAEVNAVVEDGSTVLMRTASNGRLEVVRYFVEEGGGDVNATDGWGKTALMYAAVNGYVEVVRYLVEEGSADVNATNTDGEAALMFAAVNGYFKVVQYLVEEGGADVNVKNKYGETALMHAARYGHLRVVWYLRKSGNTTLIANIKYLKLVRYLVEKKGADVNIKDNDGNTALNKAVKYRKWDVVRYLVAKGADVNAKDSDGSTALIKAIHYHEWDMAWYLVPKGADVNAEDNEGSTALMKAAESDELDVVRYLMENGADVNVKDNSGNNALMKAAESGELDVVRYLVENGADINANDNCGNTALMEAAAKGHLDVVRHLVEKGSDANTRNTKRETALYHATKHGHIAIQNFLLKHVSLSEVMVKVESSVESLKTFLKSRSWAISPFDIEMVEYNDIRGEYRAKWLDADVVVKLFLPGASASTFENEVTTWLQLRHPNVVKLYGACDIGHSFFVLEYASNGSVVEYLLECKKKGKRQTPWKLLHEASLGLAYLHERGIIHGNLRGSNVLIGSDGVAKLTDFGLSMSSQNGPEEGSSSRAGFGSAIWKAPEHLESRKASLAGDIYSFGLCIVAAITGQEPWKGDFEWFKQFWDPATDPDWSSPANLDENTRLLASRMCTKDPKKRVTAGVVVRLLEKLAAKEASDAEQPSRDDDVEKNMDEYEDGILIQLVGKIRNQILLQYAQNPLYELVLKEIETIHHQLAAQDSRSLRLLEAYRLLLVELDGVLQSGLLQDRVVTLSSTRSAGSNLTVFRRRINELWMTLDDSRVGDEEREQQWDLLGMKQLEVFVSDVSQTVNVLSKLDNEEERTGFMTLLKLELDTHGSKYTDCQLKVMEKAFDDCCQGKWMNSVTTIPAWYLPWHELVINRMKKLGEGGFGDVYLAKWLESEVVVKEVKKLEASNGDSRPWQSLSESMTNSKVRAATDDFKSREERRKLFEKEVKVWFGLSHPHVIRLFGACHVGTPFFACEYARGGSLDKYLQEHPDEIWVKLFEAALGVQYLHSRGIIHGDLKCNNIMIGNDGKAKVTDFGLSSFEEASEARLSGAWQWVAPECIEGGTSKRSFASDVYSLGMCIVEALRVVENVEDDCRPPLPWWDFKNDLVKTCVVKRCELPSRPRLCTNEQWQLVERMCAHDPNKRIKIRTVVDKLEVLARGNGFCDDEVVEPERELPLLLEIITQMKGMCCQLYKSATSHNEKILSQMYALLWDRLACLMADSECLGSLIERARESTLALQEEKGTIFAFTEAALRGYALHRNLDKVIEAKRWTVDKLEWRDKCWELLASQATL